MKKVKYQFDPITLTYKNLEKGLSKRKLWTFLGHAAVSMALGIVFFFVASFVFETPYERNLRRENAQLSLQYELINKKFHNVSQVLDEMQDRDNNIYRVIFGAEPIPKSVREAGFGGADRYGNLSGYATSKVMTGTTQKLDKILKQVYIQSKSFDEIVDLVKDKQKMLTCVPAIQPLRMSSLKCAPYGYGYRIDPVYKTPEFHEGMDFAAASGTEIYATGDGVIMENEAGYSGYGNYVRINHGFGYRTLYGHMSKILAKPGQRVKRGDVIGLVGSTGKSVGPHLHYEVHFNGSVVNPINYFYNDISPEEYDTLITKSLQGGQSLD